MEITVQGKQIDVGDALTDHVKGKLAALDQKYFNHATDAAVTFSKEGHGTGMFKAIIAFNVGRNIEVVTEATEQDPYAAFDGASEKAAKRLRRYKERIRNHKSRVEKTPESEMMKAKAYTLIQDALEAGGEEEAEAKDPTIIAEIQTTILKMSVSDAVMRMELSGRNALMFRNASNNKLSMVYVRRDGNIGWIEPDEA
ncbi:MAG: ribosome-associated translation inhibitor RaiA [Alphaproteobacteria bacterium]|nr:ribosome-associated translation inhibitor RaiA [Alphaproteobacteria bacterium]